MHIGQPIFREDNMGQDQEISGKRASGSDKSKEPQKGGDAARKAQEWGGGSKGAKGPVTAADRRNENSSARS
jgi:hypothetical protein